MSRHSKRIREELSALLDGELGEERARALQRMIAADPTLRAEWEQLEKTSQLVRKAPLEKAPESVRQAVLARVAPGGKIHRLPRFLALWGVAAAALVAVGLFLHFQPEGSAPGSQDNPGSKENYLAENGAGDARSKKGELEARETADRPRLGAPSKARPYNGPHEAPAKDAGATIPKTTFLQGKVGEESSKQVAQPASSAFLLLVEKKAKVPAAPESRIAYLTALSEKSREVVQQHIALVARSAFVREAAEAVPAASGAAGKAGAGGSSGASGSPAPSTPAKEPAPPAANSETPGSTAAGVSGLVFGGGTPPLLLHASSKKEAELLRGVLVHAYAPKGRQDQSTVPVPAAKSSQLERGLASGARPLRVHLDLGPEKAAEVRAWLALWSEKPAKTLDELSRSDRAQLDKLQASGRKEVLRQNRKGGAKEAAGKAAGDAGPSSSESIEIRIEYPAKSSK